MLFGLQALKKDGDNESDDESMPNVTSEDMGSYEGVTWEFAQVGLTIYRSLNFMCL